MNDDIEALVSYCSMDGEWDDFKENLDNLEPHFSVETGEQHAHWRQLREKAIDGKLDDDGLRELAKLSRNHILCSAIRIWDGCNEMKQCGIRLTFPSLGPQLSIEMQRDELQLTFLNDRFLAERIHDGRSRSWSIGFHYENLVDCRPPAQPK